MKGTKKCIKKCNNLCLFIQNNLVVVKTHPLISWTTMFFDDIIFHEEGHICNTIGGDKATC